MPQERLQKILAAAGIASRRKAEELISSGHVEVNGQVVTELGTKADPRKDHIRVDGKLLSGPERPVYIMMHKPKGHVTTVTDPEGRPTVMDLVRGIPERIFPVGRLDYLSEGLLLLTNDGELMQKLTHASSHVPKTYEVKVSGRPAEELIDKLRAGILLPPEPTRAGTRGGTQEGMKRRSEAVRTQPAQIDLSKDQENPWYEITLTEGRNRQIRRMFEEIGHHVEKIKRTRYGTLELDLEPGQWRTLSPKEVSRLRASIGKPFVITPPRRRPQAPAPVERRELSAYDIRGLRDRAQAEGAEKPKRPMRQSEDRPRGDRPVRPTFEKRGAPRPPASRDRKPFGAPRPPSSGERGDFPRDRKRPAAFGQRGDAPRTGGMRDDSERPNRPPRFDRERPAPRGDRQPRFDRSEGRPERPKRFEFDRPRAESKQGPRGPRPSFDRSRGERPDGPRSPRSDRPSFDRPRGDRPQGPRGPRAGRPSFERSDRARGERPSGPRGPRTERPSFDRPRGERGASPRGERPRFEGGDRPRGGRPQGSGGGRFGKGPKRGNDRPGKRNR